MELWTSFSVKEGVKPEKRGFQPMRKKLGEKFGVVFSFSVVVTGTELLYFLVAEDVVYGIPHLQQVGFLVDGLA